MSFDTPFWLTLPPRSSTTSPNAIVVGASVTDVVSSVVVLAVVLVVTGAVVVSVVDARVVVRVVVVVVG